MQNVNVGFVGTCPPTPFNADEAQQRITEAFDAVAKCHPNARITLVSGLSSVGTLAIAYAEAAKRGWRTVGIACQRAFEHPLYPVDKQYIVGEKWGDESEAFVAAIDEMVRVGGGKQSHDEIAAAKAAGKPTYEYELS